MAVVPTTIIRLLRPVPCDVKIKITDAFFEPLPEEELKRWEGG